MTLYRNIGSLLPAALLIVLCSCGANKMKLNAVSYANFEAFVNETGYTTDAEKYGWSIVQKDVYSYDVVDGVNWRNPNGSKQAIAKNLPVTQVSFNDAIAYCKWAHKRLPTYEEYWELVKSDERKIVSENVCPISPVQEVNVVGNVWDITQAHHQDSVRLAGGSLFCTKKACHGTVSERVLYVDKETGNVHIGFSVLEN